MAFFDGTFETTEEKLLKEFPIFVTNNLRMDNKHKRIAIINDFSSDSMLGVLSDPHMENGAYNSKTFYHIFFNEDAKKAKEVIEDFVKRGYGIGDGEVSLYKKENNNIFLYSYGELHPEIEVPNDSLVKSIKDDYYILPLKIYTHACPVCGEKTLLYRGMFEICHFCGWEDEGIDCDDDEPSFGPNGAFNIKEYRKEYKRQLKMRYDKPYEELTKSEKTLPNWKWKKEDK